MHGFLIDMDGVIYRGSSLIAGADQFIRGLRQNDIPFRFLTNNSQRTRRDVATKLLRMGIEIDEQHVFTCAMATARFLAEQKPGGTALLSARAAFRRHYIPTATRSWTKIPITSWWARAG